MPRWSNKLSEFERIWTEQNRIHSSRIRSSRAEYARVEPNTLESSRIRSSRAEYARVEPNTLESSRIRSSRAEYARVEPNTLEPSRVSRTRGVACSVYFEQPLRRISYCVPISVCAFVLIALHSATLTPNHGSYKNISNSTGKQKRKVMRTRIEWKKEINAKFENGVRVSDPASQYNMTKSTISTFLRNKEAMKAADVANGLTIVHHRQRPMTLDEIEKMLLIWIKEKDLDGDSITEDITCVKVLYILADLLK